MLNEVADGVWVRHSAWVLSNAIAVRGESGFAAAPTSGSTTRLVAKSSRNDERRRGFRA